MNGGHCDTYQKTPVILGFVGLFLWGKLKMVFLIDNGKESKTKISHLAHTQFFSFSLSMLILIYSSAMSDIQVRKSLAALTVTISWGWTAWQLN